MTELRVSRREEIPRLKELWKLAFGDEDRYIDYFFDHLYTPERMILLAEDGIPMTMLALLPMVLSDRWGSPSRMAYIYALATDPAARLKGYGRQLLHYADRYAREKGYHCISTLPAELSLHRFFSTVGFHECFATRQAEVLWQHLAQPGEDDLICPTSAQDYLSHRCRLLDGIPHLACGLELIEYQRGISRMSGADLYALKVGTLEGIAAAERLSEDSVLVKELLIEPSAIPIAAGLIGRELPAVRYYFRTPAPWTGLSGSYIQPFAMMKWYDEERQETWGSDTNCYMGIAFD